MKTAYCGFVLAAAFLCASCGELYNGQSGEGTFVYIPAEGPVVPAADSLFDVPGKFPALGNVRLGAYNASGKMIREAAGNGKLEFTLPAGGPYWLDFSAPVIHDSNPETDPFPFVKSFGATVKIEKVTAGSSREISLPLRVRETVIMVPYLYSDKELSKAVFVPFYDLPAQYPVSGPLVSVDKGMEEICFDFDPFGRLFAMESGVLGKCVYRRNTLSSPKELINTLPSSTGEHGLAFNVLNGRLYYAYLGGTGLNQNKYVLSEYDVSRSGQGTLKQNTASNLSSALITIDEEGFLYGVTGPKNDIEITVRKQGAYWTESSSSLSMRSVAGSLPEDNGIVENISDLKALNGYLYVLFTVISGNNGYCAAIPLESVRAGTLGGAWFAGSMMSGEQTGAPDLFSTAGFYGLKKFVGWGPDRLYIYDVHGNGEDSFHRIVELNLRDRKISKAGLIVEAE
jgi:hypothetical protein